MNLRNDTCYSLHRASRDLPDSVEVLLKAPNAIAKYIAIVEVGVLHSSTPTAPSGG